MNAHTPGPLAVQHDLFGLKSEQDLQLVTRLPYTFIVARVNRFAASHGDHKDEANAALLAASYTAFDKAARTLGVDALELARTLDIAALIKEREELVQAAFERDLRDAEGH